MITKSIRGEKEKAQENVVLIEVSFIKSFLIIDDLLI